MTEVKGYKCHAHFRGSDGNGTCDTDCQWYHDGVPCVMWTPEKYWGKNLCDFCRYDGDKCNVGKAISIDNGHIMACFGFEEATKI